MSKLKQSRWGFKSPNASKKTQLIKEVKNHSSWKGDMSLCELAEFLQGDQPFTYVLSEGMDKTHFFLSYVDANYIVKHKNLRVILDEGKWRIKNGGGYSFETIAPLIPDCLQCSSATCKPKP